MFVSVVVSGTLPTLQEILTRHGVSCVYIQSLRPRDASNKKVPLALRALHDAGLHDDMIGLVDAFNGQKAGDVALSKLVRLMPNYDDPVRKGPMSRGEIGGLISQVAIWSRIRDGAGCADIDASTASAVEDVVEAAATLATSTAPLPASNSSHAIVLEDDPKFEDPEWPARLDEALRQLR